MPTARSALPEEGLRARKRTETAQRISAAALRLFAAHGIEATTVDAIAAAAGISRRTFFHYFAAKDDILLSLHKGMGEQLADALDDRDPGNTPLQAVRAAALRIVAAYPLEELIVIDRLMRSSPAVQAGKQASYAREEAVLLGALERLWPDEDPVAMQMLAMLAIGVGRRSLDAWSRDGGSAPLADYVTRAFDAAATLHAAPAGSGA
jgi:AcrR family transcriptional regulator